MKKIKVGDKRMEQMTTYRAGFIMFTNPREPAEVIYVGKWFYTVRFENGIRESYYL